MKIHNVKISPYQMPFSGYYDKMETEKKGRKKFISKEKELDENLKGFRSWERNKNKIPKWIKSVVSSLDIHKAEDFLTLLDKRSVMDPTDFEEEYKKMIGPYLYWGEMDTICRALYPLVSKRVCEESSKYGLGI